MRFPQKLAEISQRAIHGMDVEIVRDVVTVVLQRGWIKREQPNRRDSEVAQVFELRLQPAKISRAIAIAVEERADVDLVNDAPLVPNRITLEHAQAAFPAGRGLSLRNLARAGFRGDFSFRRQNQFKVLPQGFGLGRCARFHHALMGIPCVNAYNITSVRWQSRSVGPRPTPAEIIHNAPDKEDDDAENHLQPNHPCADERFGPAFRGGCRYFLYSIEPFHILMGPRKPVGTSERFLEQGTYLNDVGTQAIDPQQVVEDAEIITGFGFAKCASPRQLWLQPANCFRPSHEIFPRNHSPKMDEDFFSLSRNAESCVPDFLLRKCVMAQNVLTFCKWLIPIECVTAESSFLD